MLEQKYNDIVARENFQVDSSQLELVRLLDSYLVRLEAEKKPVFLRKLIRKFSRKKNQLKHGVYVWGDVGRGKSMLMDLFYDNLTTKRKRRVHFHEFMLEFHNMLQQWRDEHSNSKKSADPIPKLAKLIAKQYQVLCFDELQVNNIADAMLLGRLFTLLLENGVFIIMTSNRIPDDLYKDGLQRENFLPFIKLVHTQMEVFQLNNFLDYRMEKLGDLTKTFFHPNDAKAQKEIDDIIFTLTGHDQFVPTSVEVNKRRSIDVERSYGSLAIFQFAELCQANYGAIDYLALCRKFSTIVILDIPTLSPSNHNEALRFITLIDCMYDNKTKLICSAAAGPNKLYTTGRGKFEFQRTVSRLIEMQSQDYLSSHFAQTA